MPWGMGGPTRAVRRRLNAAVVPSARAHARAVETTTKPRQDLLAPKFKPWQRRSRRGPKSAAPTALPRAATSSPARAGPPSRSAPRDPTSTRSTAPVSDWGRAELFEPHPPAPLSFGRGGARRRGREVLRGGLLLGRAGSGILPVGLGLRFVPAARVGRGAPPGHAAAAKDPTRVHPSTPSPRNTVLPPPDRERGWGGEVHRVRVDSGCRLVSWHGEERHDVLRTSGLGGSLLGALLRRVRLDVGTGSGATAAGAGRRRHGGGSGAGARRGRREPPADSGCAMDWPGLSAATAAASTPDTTSDKLRRLRQPLQRRPPYCDMGRAAPAVRRPALRGVACDACGTAAAARRATGKLHCTVPRARRDTSPRDLQSELPRPASRHALRPTRHAKPRGAGRPPHGGVRTGPCRSRGGRR